MAERKPEWPEDGCLVIATTETVTDYGAYAKLNEVHQTVAQNVVVPNSTKLGRQGTFRRDN